MQAQAFKKVHLNDLHFNYRMWINQLAFYKEELKIFQKRLEEVAPRNTNQDFRQQLGHFQNHLVIQNEQLDILKHDIKGLENVLERQAQANPQHVTEMTFQNDGQIRERMETFVRLYDELKHDFMRFLATWL
ncbi:MAG: hypothetical protein MUC97_03245 [Bernardetiaceae bacterium]|jgi:hypothetical protein|nr:hypothetical protein [Bernardetiaceae bacterium]